MSCVVQFHVPVIVCVSVSILPICMPCPTFDNLGSQTVCYASQAEREKRHAQGEKDAQLDSDQADSDKDAQKEEMIRMQKGRMLEWRRGLKVIFRIIGYLMWVAGDAV